MRILHVLGSLNRGGIETWLRHTVVRLPRGRYQSDFCTYRSERGAYAVDVESFGCELHHIPLGSSPVAILRFAKQFRRLLGEGHYDVVHCHGLLLVGFILFLAWLENTPVRVAHAHSVDRNARPANRLGLVLNRALTRVCSTHGITCSAETGVALFGRHWRENPKNKLIHCGVDLTAFVGDIDEEALRTALGIEPGRKTIGHVGSFSAVKNQRFLVEMAAHVFRRRPDVVLLLVGEGTLRPSIEESCLELGIRPRVIFAGESSRVPDLMRSAMDVFVMPSLHEGLGMVLLEAQAAGLPCLASDVVPHEVAVSDGAVQFLSLESGVEAWADAVLSLLEKPLRRPDLLARMVNSDFNVVVSAERLENLYRQTEIAPQDSSPVAGAYSAKV